MGYWEKRQSELYQAGEMQVNQYFARLEKAFNQTKRELQKTIEAFYFRYAEENGLSYAEAQKRLDKEELGELQDFIDLAMQNIGKYNQTVNNMSIKARITRYQALEAQVDAILRQLYAIDYESMAEETMREVYEESYYRTWYNIDQNRGFHAEFTQINPGTVEKLLEYPFNGANFSSRLWKQKDHLQTQLMESMTTMMIQGKHPKTLAADFAKKMQSKKFDAYRLLHTESSFLISEATHAGYKEDGVEKYQILATLDSKTCGVCGDLDGEVYAVDEAVVGVNMPPFHPLCRCTDTPYYDDMDLSDMPRVARDAAENYIDVPGNMTYKEWRKKFIEKESVSDIIESGNTKEAPNVHIIGKIDRDIYKCITEDILTDEVIITDERIGHIKERHPNDYERFCLYIPEIISHPDYIIEANKPNTGVILKEIEEHGEKFKLILRIKVEGDPKEYKNSIMTFWHIGETTWKKSLKNKKILYKRE